MGLVILFLIDTLFDVMVGPVLMKIEFWGRIFRDIRDPDVGISQKKTLCKWPFYVVLNREWPGCPGIWVGTSRIWKTSMQENFTVDAEEDYIYRKLCGGW